MSEQFESMKQGLTEALQYVKGNTTNCLARRKKVCAEPIRDYTQEEIKAIRNQNNMSQRFFAEIMGVTPQAVEAWEAGKRKPSGTAARLLELMEDEQIKDKIVNKFS